MVVNKVVMVARRGWLGDGGAYGQSGCFCVAVAGAVTWHLQDRVIVYGNKTVVFR
ncbi:MAG: hypothetical protein RDU30_07855 [Desulfovibrionaceae bacterium]|nr:hypothetical protein [Desulfovibrionaceae bacterium]